MEGLESLSTAVAITIWISNAPKGWIQGLRRWSRMSQTGTLTKNLILSHSHVYIRTHRREGGRGWNHHNLYGTQKMGICQLAVAVGRGAQMSAKFFIPLSSHACFIDSTWHTWCIFISVMKNFLKSLGSLILNKPRRFIRSSRFIPYSVCGQYWDQIVKKKPINCSVLRDTRHKVTVTLLILRLTRRLPHWPDCRGRGQRPASGEASGALTQADRAVAW